MSANLTTDGWQKSVDVKTDAPLAIASFMEKVKDTLRKVVADIPDLRFEDAWAEYTRRTQKSDIKAALVMDDLIWEIQVGRWPKKRKKKA